MKKILIIINTSFIIGGGITNSFMNYYNNLDFKLFQIDFASTNQISNELKEKIEKNNSKYFQLPKRKSIFKYKRNLIKILKERKYDVVHIHGNSCTTYLELSSTVKAHIPLKIVHIHNVKNNFKIINFLLKKYINNKSDIRLSCSEQAGEWIFYKKFYVMKNIINTNEFRFSFENRQLIRDIYNINNDIFLIGMVGRLNEQKNQQFIIKNFQKIKKIIPNSKLMIVGSGPLENDLKEIAMHSDFANDILFTGFKSNINMFMSAFDLLVFPSKFEGFGMVAVEAQIAGLHVISSNAVPKSVNVCGNTCFYDEDRIDLFLEKLNDTLIKLKMYDRLYFSDKSINNLEMNGFDCKSNIEFLSKIYEGKIV